MNEADAERRAEMPGIDLWGSGRNPREQKVGASNDPATADKSSRLGGQGLLEAVVERENMTRALLAVERNKGAAGVDRMAANQLRAYLRKEWPGIKESLLEGTYQPQPVLRVEIPKPGGGMRMLGIPTVVDRMIQQAVAQVISPIWERYFSNHSYGFRPGRSAHMAVKAAREYIAEGRRWVVDMDLEKFFDRVNHDVLMARVARKVSDKRLLLLIRRYLQSGIMEGGIVEQRSEGAPQGGPLSPLLSNILLDDLDKELEKRGHRFCRYADDCNVYVQSRAAGERVMTSIKSFLVRRLRLKVNEAKSQVARPSQRKFLGYSVTVHREPRLKVAGESIQRLRGKVRQLFRRGRGRNLRRFINEELNPLLRGWGNYFRLAETKGIFEELDQWIRRKLRSIIWRQWKRPWTRYEGLLRRGLIEARARESAFNGRGAWWNSGQSHMNAAFPQSYFARLGLISLLAIIQARAESTSS
jgi:RNA-directed DNA polymerase